MHANGFRVLLRFTPSRSLATVRLSARAGLLCPLLCLATPCAPCARLPPGLPPGCTARHMRWPLGCRSAPRTETCCQATVLWQAALPFQRPSVLNRSLYSSPLTAPLVGQPARFATILHPATKPNTLRPNTFAYYLRPTPMHPAPRSPAIRLPPPAIPPSDCPTARARLAVQTVQTGLVTSLPSLIFKTDGVLTWRPCTPCTPCAVGNRLAAGCWLLRRGLAG
jgi:hypothetical protein